MPQDEISALPLHLQDLVNREVERRLNEAEQEKQLPLDALPIPQQIGNAPRDVSLSVWLYLRLCSSSLPKFGWFIAGFGFVFALIAVIIGLDDAIPRNWVDAGNGTITNVKRTNTTINDRAIYAYHFETNDGGGERISGISYGYRGRHKIGDEVSLERAGNRYRVQGLTMTTTGWLFSLAFLGAGMLFGVGGLCIPIYSWFAGGKAICLLRNGTAIGAKFIGMVETGYAVGGNRGGRDGQPVMKANFAYQVSGERYTASAYALDTSRLTDCPYKTVLYDPVKPERSVVLDGLPEGVRIDELTGRFWVNPMRLVLPLLAAIIVSGQIIAIIVLAIRAI